MLAGTPIKDQHGPGRDALYATDAMPGLGPYVGLAHGYGQNVRTQFHERDPKPAKRQPRAKAADAVWISIRNDANRLLKRAYGDAPPPASTTVDRVPSTATPIDRIQGHPTVAGNAWNLV
jgi:hypothetical protein